MSCDLCSKQYEYLSQKCMVVECCTIRSTFKIASSPVSPFNKNELYNYFPIELPRPGAPELYRQAGGCNQSSLKYTCGESKLWLGLNINQL